MEIPWNILLPSGVGALVTFAAVIGLAPTGVGDKLLGHIFDQKLNALKHEQDAKIEALRARLGVLGDRSVRANEREFAAMTAAWDSFITAFIATKACIYAFISHPDFVQMGNDAIAAYLASTALSESQQKQIIDAEDRGMMYSRVIRFRQINIAGKAIFDAREIVRKQGIFMPDTIEDAFESALVKCSAAQVEQSMRLDFEGEVGREAVTAFIKEGDQMTTALKKIVRTRLMQEDATAAA